MKPADIEGMAVVWLEELRGHTAREIAAAFEEYRKRGGGAFPASCDIIKILDEWKPLALPDPEVEKFNVLSDANRKGFLKYDEAVFLERKSEEKGWYLCREIRNRIEDAKNKHAFNSLSEEQKKAKADRIKKMIEQMKNTNQLEG